MNLTHDAMLVSLRISAWSGRLYDRKASNHVAVHHEASASAGRYNKCLLPKAAFAALTATMSKARSSHYEQTLPWDDQGSRLLTVANYEHYMELLDGLRERMVRERACFIEDYEDNIDQARLDLGKLFRIEDYPSKDALQGRFGIRHAFGTGVTLVAPESEAVHQAPAEAGMGLEIAAQLARDRRGLKIACAPPACRIGPFTPFLDAVEQRLAGRNGCEDQRYALGNCRLDLGHCRRPFDLAEWRVNDDRLFAGNDPRKENRHGLRILAA